MEILREILRVVTSKSDPKKTLPELSDSPEENITTRFLLGVSEGKYRNDDEAAMDIYGSSHSDQRYRTLKSRSFERLLHALLFLQVKQPEHSEYLSYYYKCTRNLIAAQTLMRFASRKAGTQVAERTLTVAKKYEFTDLCLNLTVLLRETAGIFTQKKQFLEYNEQLKYYLRLLDAEYRSDELLDMLIMEYRHTRRTKLFLKDLSETYLNELDQLHNTFGSHSLTLNRFRLLLVYFEIRDDFQSIIDACDNAILYLNGRPHLIQKARLGEFGLTKMLNCIIVRRFRDALPITDNVITSFIEGGNNWFFSIDLSFLIAMHCGDYQRAANYYDKATSHRSFQLQGSIIHELWMVYAAYLHIVELFGLYQPSNSTRKSSFRLSTFLNSVPEMSKDKKVANLMVLIAHVVILILNSDFDTAEKRIDYLRVYMSRYLKERDFNRARYFLKLLNSFARCSFEPTRIRRENQPLFEQMQATYLDPMPGDTTEILPYELLYEQLLLSLERQLVEP